MFHAHHLRPLRQGPDDLRGAPAQGDMLIRDILDRMRHDGWKGGAAHLNRGAPASLP
jgi:hypothetical protein